MQCRFRAWATIQPIHLNIVLWALAFVRLSCLNNSTQISRVPMRVVCPQFCVPRPIRFSFFLLVSKLSETVPFDDFPIIHVMQSQFSQSARLSLLLSAQNWKLKYKYDLHKSWDRTGNDIKFQFTSCGGSNLECTVVTSKCRSNGSGCVPMRALSLVLSAIRQSAFDSYCGAG